MSDAVGYASAQLSDLLKGLQEGVDSGLAIAEAPKVNDRRALDMLILLVESYDENHPALPKDPRDSVAFQRVGRRALSHSAFDSIMTLNLAQMNAHTGIQTNRVEATGYDRLISACTPAAHQILVKGPKGAGKSTKIFDIAKRLLAEGVIEKVLTNVKGPDEHPAVEFSEDISRYLEFAKEPGEKLAIIDEFSTVGNAYVAQHDVEQVLSRVINAFRKSMRGSLRTAYIGHENDNDIHPLVKKQSDVVIQADGKVDEGLIDCATVYSGWQEYKTDKPWFRVRGLQDIPQSSSWSFDTNYFAHLEFDLDDPENQIRRGKLIDNWEAYQEGEVEEDDEDASPWNRCRGTSTKTGERCGTRHGLSEDGFCASHVGEDPHPDAPDEPEEQ